MCVHNATAVEVWLVEMDNTQFRACGDVHQCLFIFDFLIGAMLVSLQPPCLVELGMQLLQSMTEATFGSSPAIFETVARWRAENVKGV
jgi:hypothetical protein